MLRHGHHPGLVLGGGRGPGDPPAYDRDTSKSFLGRERTWRFLRERKWIAGGFQWAGIEHRGETVWPRLCSQSGAVDLFLNRKDAFYQNQSLWLEKPMVHLLPHWNLPGREGEPIRVVAYTNCPRVELLVNGVSQGIQAIDSCGHGQWQVEYHPGAIEAVAYAGDERWRPGNGWRPPAHRFGCGCGP